MNSEEHTELLAVDLLLEVLDSPVVAFLHRGKLGG